MIIQKKYFFRILLILAFAVLLSGCNEPNAFSFMPDDMEYEGMYYKNLSNDVETNLNFELENEEVFTKNVIIANMTNNEINYKMLVFVDYNQVDYILDGEERLYYDFSLESKTEKELPITIGKLNSGSHDIMFLFAKDTENMDDDIDYRLNTKFAGMTYSIIRVTVVNTDNKNEYMVVDSYEEETAYEQTDINIVSDENTIETSFMINPNDEYKYSVIVNNGANTNNFALIALFNFKQISIDKDNKVQYFCLPPNHTYKFEGSVTYKDTNDSDSLIYILIENPYEEIEYYRKAYFSTRLNICYE